MKISDESLKKFDVGHWYKFMSEAIIVHPPLLDKRNRVVWDARIIGTIDVEEKRYEFNQIVRLKLKQKQELE